MDKAEKTTTELSFEEEVEEYLNMDPEERHRQAQRQMAEAIVRHRRRAEAERAKATRSRSWLQAFREKLNRSGAARA